MTHIGKECRFEPVGFFSFLFRLNQFQFHVLAGGDVSSQFHDSPSSVEPFDRHTLDGVPAFGFRIIVFPEMNTRKLTVGIEQLRFRAMFHLSFRPAFNIRQHVALSGTCPASSLKGLFAKSTSRES